MKTAQILPFTTSKVATLSSSAMLVELSISLWSGFKLDKKVSTEIDIVNSTSTRAGNYNKKLFAGDPALPAIQKVATMIREYHNNVTSPWSDKGPRLLPTALFLDYKTEIARLERVYLKEVRNFTDDYYNKVRAASLALGDLFDRDEYPDIETVQNRFGIRVRYTPLPEAGDFRLDVGNQGLTELREQYEALYQENIINAMDSAWQRLYETLDRLSRGLRVNEDGKKGRLFGSVIEDAVELCNLLTPLNITNDTRLEAMRQSLEQALLGVEAEDLRKSDYARVLLKSKVDSILDKF